MGRVELSRKWWRTSCPKDVDGARLEKALDAFDDAPGDAVAAALAGLPPAIRALASKLDKKSHKAVLLDLEALESLVAAETKRVAADAKKRSAAAADSPAPETPEHGADAALFDPKTTASVLRKAQDAPIVFGFALARKVDECAIAVALRGNPRRLLAAAKERAQVDKGCCGRAKASKEDAKTLILTLDGPPPGPVAGMLRLHLRHLGITTYTRIDAMYGKHSDEDADGGLASSDSWEAPIGDMPPGSDEKPIGGVHYGDAPLDLDAEFGRRKSSSPEDDKARAEADMLMGRVREVAGARTAWARAKAQVATDLEKVAARARRKVGAAQFRAIDQGCKDVAAVLDGLDAELKQALRPFDTYPLPKRPELAAAGASATAVVDRRRALVAANEFLRTVDLKQLADVAVQAPVLKALDDLRSSLAI
jgi:hypothetical protein